MQHAYATSGDALSLLAETETVMGAARTNAPTLPEHGQSAPMTIGNQDSLDVLQAPRDCECHVGGNSFTMHLVPQAGASIQAVTAAAMPATPAGPQGSAPTIDPGMGRKK